jgi:quercetin dioxygenase-like cupin family protein
MLVSGAQSQTSKEQTIRIVRSASQPSRQGPVENFTGSVRVDPLFQAIAPARASGSLVTFEPGARTAWHTHPLGQILIVTTGTGRVQRWGDSAEEIRQGDVVWIPPGQKHWHGAAPNSSMAHIAIVEQLDGKAVDWMERSHPSTMYETLIPAFSSAQITSQKRDLSFLMCRWALDVLHRVDRQTRILLVKFKTEPVEDRVDGW